MIKLIGFLPDLDPTTPGIFKDCTNIIPSVKGFKSAPSTQTAGLTAVSAATNSLAVVQKLDGTNFSYAGTTTTLEEAGSSGWTDRTRAVGGDYSCGTDSRWSFAQFGNVTLAANVADTMQVATTGSSAFADIPGSPQAEYIAVSNGFVMAVNTSSNSDEWHCSAYNDHTDWTESVSTQCTSGRVIGGGRFTGVKPFGTGFVAWKSNSSYIATYVGAPVVFQWDEVPGDVGCHSGHAAVDVGDRVVFQGNDDFFIFDGANNNSIGEGIREWFFTDADPTYLYRTIATYNPNTANVTFHYVSTANGTKNPDKAVVYNMRSGKWGKYSLQIESAANYYTAGVTYEGLGTLYSTYDDLPTDISYDSPYWLSGSAQSAVIKSDQILYTLTGSSTDSSFTLNTIGDDEEYTTITRARPRFLTEPNASTLTYYYDDGYGETFTEHSTTNLSNYKYDIIHSAKWHQLQFNFSGDMEITSVIVNLIGSGSQ